MQAKTTFKKTAVKHSKTSAPPVPNLITQVKKDDEKPEKKFKLFDVMNIFRCCSLFWKCIPTKKSNFDQITETAPALLEPQLAQFKGKKVLVLDLDETLVHSTFEPVENPDLILPVKIQGMTYKINVIKRPGAEEFLAKVKGMFEVVVFTASLAEYAEPLVEILDPTGSVSSLLYRQHCTPLNGIYVKDLSLLGRDMKDIILVDNSPNSFLFQPENAYHIKNFFDDKTDRELLRLAAFLDNITKVTDVRPIEELRRKYEPPASAFKNFKFVKVDNQQDSGDTDMPELNVVDPSKQPVKRREERERSYNIETEPDLRKDARGGEFNQYRLPSERNKNQANYMASKAAPLTERVPSNDRFGVPALDSSVDIELPSPKESDALINHREADAYYDETDSKERNLPPYLQSTSPVLATIKKHEANVVAVDEPEIEGHKVEDVRYDIGFGNLNSPLGRHAKIEFNNNKKSVGS